MTWLVSSPQKSLLLSHFWVVAGTCNDRRGGFDFFTDRPLDLLRWRWSARVPTIYPTRSLLGQLGPTFKGSTTNRGRASHFVWNHDDVIMLAWERVLVALVACCRSWDSETVCCSFYHFIWDSVGRRFPKMSAPTLRFHINFYFPTIWLRRKMLKDSTCVSRDHWQAYSDNLVLSNSSWLTQSYPSCSQNLIPNNGRFSTLRCNNNSFFTYIPMLYYQLFIENVNDTKQTFRNTIKAANIR